MVLCVVFGCGSRSDREKGIGFYRIPSVINNKSAFEEELTTERREKWIQAIRRGDTKAKDVLKSERVCDKHFVPGKPSPYWDKHNVDWVPTLELGYGRETDYEARAKRQERAKKREKHTIEQEEREAAEKRRKLGESSLPMTQIDFDQSSTSTEEEKTGNEDAFSGDLTAYDEGSESDEIRTKIMRDAECQADTELKDSECQTTELEYIFPKSTYRAPDKEFFDSDEKVGFYTGLPSLEVLMVVFDHVASHVKRQTQSLDRFQEFIIVLMKLRLNVPLQDLPYHFVVLISTISRIFFHWIVVMDKRLFPLFYWPERHQLWKTMPQCFRYAFCKKTTVVIDCFEVFIERPSNLLARAETFSSNKHHNTIKILAGITPKERFILFRKPGEVVSLINL